MADQRDGSGGPVIKEDIRSSTAVDLPRDQVRCEAPKDERTAVGTESRGGAGAIGGDRWRAGASADQAELSRVPVVQEDIGRAVGVGNSWEQIGGGAGEDEKTAVGAQVERHGTAAGAGAGTGRAARHGRAVGESVIEEGMGPAVQAFAGNEIGERPGEGEIPAVAELPFEVTRGSPADRVTRTVVPAIRSWR